MRRLPARPYRTILLATAAAVVMTAACSDSSGPDDGGLAQGQDFPLYEIGLSPLPVLDKVTLFGARLMVIGGTVRVLSRDRVLFVTEVEYRSNTNPPDITVVSPESLTVSYTRVGDQLLVPFANGPNGAYTDTITIMNGFLRASRFRSHHEGAYQRRDYIYLTR